MDNEFILYDRLEKIRDVVGTYGAHKFYISYSGGKDSVVLSELVDLALRGNNIPRVFADTGIELKLIRDFVLNNAKYDDRIVILKPEKNIKESLENDGYPFKSKTHSMWVKYFQKFKTLENHSGLQHYLGVSNDGVKWSTQNSCPKKLLYQFDNDFKLKISDNCCKNMKVNPLKKWAKDNNKPYTMIGTMREEGGRRSSTNCLSFVGGKLKSFQPLAPLTKEWETWFINEYGVDICDIYKPPYNFARTGCKGCPFALDLQDELDILEQFFPNERKQSEYIWKPVYDEYRRLGYRLKGE